MWVTGIQLPLQTVMNMTTWAGSWRLLKRSTRMEVALSHFEYEGIGQLKVKHLHNDQQHTSFAYNERGWLKGIRSNEFSMELKYDVAVNGVSNQFNGDIANQVFNNGNGDNTFNYSYDKLNRLTVGEVSSTLLSERLSYDVMGNIKTLSRDGSGDHQYHYIGNKLNYAEQMTNGYGYDVNGNTTLDGRNGMALTYNHLNLPETAGKAGMSLVYTYDATGKKLSKNANGSIRNYVDGIAYKPDNTIDFIHTEEGIARNSGGNYVYEYNLTDHLGNVRYSFNQNGTKLQSDDYYAFGKRKTPAFLSSTDNKYLYNGKELQEELDGQYDYGARFYDPVIGRFNTIDPLSEISRRNNAYNYALNNPIRFIDVDGMYADDPPWKKLLDFFGIGTQSPKSKEEIIQKAEGQERLSKLEARNKEVENNLDKADYVPFLGSAMKMSKGMVNGDNTTVASGAVAGLVDAFGGKIASKVTEKVLGPALRKIVGEGLEAAAESAEKSFFSGTKYTDKVLGQIKKGDFHAFPESVKAFESSGVTSTIKGGDGITRQILKIPGEYGGKKGVFEFIKEANGSINHRLFKVNP